MAVELRKTTFQDPEVNRLRSDVDTAVRDLSAADAPTVVVKKVTGNLTLTGDEDYVLVDMSAALRDVYLLLPAPGALERAVTVKIVNSGKSKLYLKGSDNGQVLINSSAVFLISDSVKVVATPTQFYTV